MENRIERILAIGTKAARVQDSCQTLGQVTAAMQYTQLAKAQIRREIIASLPERGLFSRAMGKLGFK
jgi:hypothetical protein